MQIPRYDRVLVTTDFSRLGNAAIPHAYALLGRGPGVVTMCHVLEVPSTPNPLYAHYSPVRVLTGDERAALAERMEEKLRCTIPKGLAKGVRTEIRVFVGAGPVHEAIHRAARDSRAKVIVIASHGHSGLARALLGSTAERVLRTARQPVLVIQSRVRG